MERLFPKYAELVSDEIYSDLVFPEPPPGRPYVAINMVTSVDGKATNLHGTVQTLSTRTDRTSMRRIRTAADAVMNGAETLRKENVNPTVPDNLASIRVDRGLSPQPVAITITASGNLSLDRTFFQVPETEKVIVTTSHAPRDRMANLSEHARILVAGENVVDVRLMMRLLREDVGIRWLVVEGGPTLNSELISQGLADELFWTISPKILGGHPERTMVEELPIPQEDRPSLDLLSIYRHESELYLRYRIAGSAT